MTKTQAVDIHGRSYHRTIMFVLMLIATLAGSLMQSTLGTALPTLMDKFSIDLNTAQQATTWFLLALGVMVPVSSYLVKKVPTKPLTIITYAFLLIGVLVTCLTPEKHDMWWMFVVGRVIAAAAVGISMPLLQIAIVNIYSKEERSFAMGLMGLVVGMSPAIGPTLTGWILNRSHLVVVLVLLPFFMRDIIPNEDVKLDLWSLLLSSFGFGLFLLGFTNVSNDGWSALLAIDAPIVIGLLLIIIFIWRQLKMEKPFLDVRVFKSWDFSVATIAVSAVMMAMMGVEMMLPTYLQNIHGMSALDSGLTLLPGALFIGFLSPVAGILYSKAGIKRVGVAGLLVLSVGTIPFAFITASTPSLAITLMYTIRMIGVAMVLMPLTSLSMDVLPKAKAADGTAVNNTARQIASSVGVALLTSVTQNTINNHKPGMALKLADPLKYAAKTLDASMDGFRLAFQVGLAFAVIGMIVVMFLKEANRQTNK